MPTIVSGCTIDDANAEVRISQGTATGITLEPTVLGVYSGCQLHILDHIGLTSNIINLPTFVYGDSIDDVCAHPDINIPLAECQALATFYTDMDGVNWTYDTNWFTEVDVDSWYGISLTGAGVTKYVNGISMPSNNIAGDILDYLFLDIPNLATLDLRNNSITTLTSDIEFASALKTLILSQNDLLNIPVEIGNLSQLDYLDLAYNGLTSFNLDASQQLDQLDVLYLNNNVLTSVSSEILNLNELDILTLNNNQLTTALPLTANTGQLVQLDSLNLAYNLLS